jgi:hypothetical protein
VRRGQGSAGKETSGAAAPMITAAVADASARLKLAQAWDTDVPPSVLVCSAEAVRDEVG